MPTTKLQPASETPERAEALPAVDVCAAGLRIERRQPRRGRRVAVGDDGGDAEADQQTGARGRGGRSEHDEDAGADHRTEPDGDGVDVPSRRLSGDVGTCASSQPMRYPSGVLAASHQGLAGGRRRGRDQRHEDHGPAGDHEWDGPRATHEKRGLAFVDVVLLTDARGGLGELGQVPRPAFDLPAVLVVVVEEDREVQGEQADRQYDGGGDSGVGKAVVTPFQDVPPFMSLQTFAKRLC